MPQNKEILRKLDWDTEYFGVSCAKLELTSAMDEEQFVAFIDEARNFDFVCIANHECNVGNNALIAKHTSAFIADTNIQFKKQLKPTNTQNASIARSNYPYDRDICTIAQNEYRASRFILDERLRDIGGNELYVQWVKNAFNKDDKFFILSKGENGTDGFILFSECGDWLSLELIGVTISSQRRGIGNLLWLGLEQEAAIRGFSGIRVGTQLANMHAINFYNKNGCIMTGCSQVYHWWTDDLGSKKRS